MNIEKTLSALRNQTELDNLEEINILRICLSKYHKDINYQCDICKDTEFPNFGIFMDHCYKEHLPLLYLKSNNWGIMSVYKYNNFIQINNGSVNDEYYKNRLSKAFVYFSNDFELRFRCNMCEDHDFFNFEEVLAHFHKTHPHSFDFENELVYMILNIQDDKKYKRESKRIFHSDSRERRLTPQRSLENNERERSLRSYNRDDECYDKNRDESNRNRNEGIRRPNKSLFDIRQHLPVSDLPIMETRNKDFGTKEYQPERFERRRLPVERPVREQPFFEGRNISLPLRGQIYPEERMNSSFLRTRNSNSIFARIPKNRNEPYSLEREHPSEVRRLSSSLFSQNPNNLRNYGNTKSLMEREQSQRNLHSSFRGILSNASLPKIIEYCRGSTTKTFINNLAGGHILKKDRGNSFSEYLGKTQTAHTSNTSDNTSNGSKFKSSSYYTYIRNVNIPIKNNTTSEDPANKKVKINNTTPNRSALNDNVGQIHLNPSKPTETTTLTEKIIPHTSLHLNDDITVIKTEKLQPKSIAPFPDQLDVDDESERMFPEENDVLPVIEVRYRNTSMYLFKCIICEEQGKSFPQIVHHLKVAHRKLFGSGRKDFLNFYLYSEDISYSKMNYEEKIELREQILDMRAGKKAELRQEHNLDHVKLPKIIQFNGDWIELAVMKAYCKTGKFLFICDICLEVQMTPLRKFLKHLFDCHANCLSYEIIRDRRAKSGTLVFSINNVSKYLLSPRSVQKQMRVRRRRQFRRKETRIIRLKSLGRPVQD